MADAAGCEHDCARSDGDGPCRRIVGLTELQSGDGAVVGEQRLGEKSFDHADRGRLAHGVGERGDDRLARHVAADMHDAARRMRGFAADRELAFEIAIEGDTVMQEVVDSCRRFLRQRQRHALIDDATTDRDRVGSV